MTFYVVLELLLRKYIYIYKSALEVVAQKLEELVKKEPVTPSATVLNIQTASSQVSTN